MKNLFYNSNDGVDKIKEAIEENLIIKMEEKRKSK